MAGTQEATRTELRDLLERGALYADRFPPSLRDALDVADPLTDLVTSALGERKSVVLSGNAGDGKSHLAQRALDALPTRSCIEVTAGHPAGGQVPQRAGAMRRLSRGLAESASVLALRRRADNRETCRKRNMARQAAEASRGLHRRSLTSQAACQTG
jgi:hypothetical protein